MSAEIVQFLISNENRAHIERRIRDVLDAHGSDIRGFALVVWAKDGMSTADFGHQALKDGETGPIMPDILIPDFVRARLLALKIEEWAVDTIRGNHQKPPDDPA